MSPELVSRIKKEAVFKLKFETPEGSEGLVRLVRIDPEDAALLSRWRTRYHDRFFTRIKPGESDVMGWLRKYESHDADLLFIIENPAGVPVGQIALSSIDTEKKTAEFGRVIRGERTAAGNVMACASSALLRWSFRHLGVDLVCLSVFSDNAKALSLYEKIGFSVSEYRLYRETAGPSGIKEYSEIKDMRSEYPFAGFNVVKMTLRADDLRT